MWHGREEGFLPLKGRQTAERSEGSRVGFIVRQYLISWFEPHPYRLAIDLPFEGEVTSAPSCPMRAPYDATGFKRGASRHRLRPDACAGTACKARHTASVVLTQPRNVSALQMTPSRM